MKKVLYFYLPLLLAFTLTGCFSNKNEPSTKDILSALKFELPHYVEVKDVQVEVSENIGSEVEPQIRSRFKGEIVLTEALYKTKAAILDKEIIEEVVAKGMKFNIYGISSSKYRMEKWIIDFDKLEISPLVSGRPLSNWKTNEYVLSGSDEEGELIEENERQIALRKKQDEARLAKQKEEAEKKRLSAEKKRIEDHEFIVSVLKSGRTVTGKAGNRSKKWPFRLTFENYSESEETFSGKMEWPSLGGVTKISGNLVGNTIVFKEMAYIKKGNVALNTVYEMDTVNGKKISGSWNRKSNNWVWFSTQ